MEHVRDHHRAVEVVRSGLQELPASGQSAGGHHGLIDPHRPRPASRHPQQRDARRASPSTSAPEGAADRVDRDVLTRQRHRRPDRSLGPHRPGRDRGGEFDESAAPLPTGQQQATRSGTPALRRAGDARCATGSHAPMPGEHHAAGARLSPAGQFDHGDRSSWLHPATGTGSDMRTARSLGWLRHLEHRGRTCSRSITGRCTHHHGYPGRPGRRGHRKD
jgi:hypothetical protein